MLSSEYRFLDVSEYFSKEIEGLYVKIPKHNEIELSGFQSHILTIDAVDNDKIPIPKRCEAVNSVFIEAAEQVIFSIK